MSSMGMNKSGTQTLARASWVKLTSFTVRSGYPDTVISNDALVMNAPGIGDITFQVSFESTGDVQQVRVVKNGSTVLGSAVNVGVLGTISGHSVTAGDTLELQGYSDSFFTTRTRVTATSTFLAFDQTTQDHPASSGPEVGWYTSSSVEAEKYAAANPTTLGWSTTAGVDLDVAAEVSPSIGWEVDAFLYKPENYEGTADTVIGWHTEADLTVLRKAQPPEVLWEDTAVSVHTADGRLLGALLCSSMEGITWGRELREVSSCEITALTQADPDLFEDLRPWVHWVTVWHGERPVWSGPIQQAAIGRTRTRITAKDTGTFMWRTRVPITRQWADTDPTKIAATVLASMNELHGITAPPIVLPAVTDAFTYAAVADSRMLHQMFDDLVKLGLEWTVVAGRFILGKFPEAPVATLAECDFLVEIERMRDGTATFNDVRVQGQNWAQSATAPLAGLRLQTLVSLDDVFGVSNIQKAARLYAAETAAIRDVLVLPPSSSLHPEADVDFDDLIPGKVLLVQAEGVSSLMRIDQVNVSASPAGFDTQITLVAIQNRGEIAELVGR